MFGHADATYPRIPTRVRLSAIVEIHGVDRVLAGLHLFYIGAGADIRLRGERIEVGQPYKWRNGTIFVTSP